MDEQEKHIVMYTVRKLIEESIWSVENEARRLTMTMERTLNAMQQADQIASLAADKMVRKLRGPLYRVRRR